MSNTKQNVNTKIIRIPASQSAPYTSSSSRVNVDIPQGLIIDMDRSYLEVQLNINSTDGDPATGEGIYKFQMGAVTDSAYNVNLIKNCKLSSEQGGILEETQHVNFLRNTLNQYQLSFNEKSSNEYNSINSVPNRYNTINNIFGVYNKEGVDPSYYNTPSLVPVKMNQLFGLGSMELNTGKLGSLNVQVELNIQNSNAILGIYDNGTDTFNCDDLDAGSDIIKLDTAELVLSSVPFYIGQKVKIMKNSGTADVHTNIIEKIERDPSTGEVSITVNGLNPVGDEVDIQMTPALPAGTTANIEWSGLSLVAYVQSEETMDTSGGIQYLTYQTERFNNSGGKNSSRTFNLPPACVNAVMMIESNSPTVTAVEVPSSISVLNSYRLVLDNINLTDRDVLFNSPLYWDNVNRFLLNNGGSLEYTLGYVVADSDYPDSFAGAARLQGIVSTPTPITEGNKILEFNVDATNINGDDWTNGYVYKQIQKVINV